MPERTPRIFSFEGESYAFAVMRSRLEKRTAMGATLHEKRDNNHCMYCDNYWGDQHFPLPHRQGGNVFAGGRFLSTSFCPTGSFHAEAIPQSDGTFLGEFVCDGCGIEIRIPDVFSLDPPLRLKVRTTRAIAQAARAAE